MPIAKHLEPATYWEKRCALLEESMVRVLNILMNTAVAPQAANSLCEHMAEWNRNIGELNDEYPAPQEQANARGNRRKDRVAGFASG